MVRHGKAFHLLRHRHRSPRDRQRDGITGHIGHRLSHRWGERNDHARYVGGRGRSTEYDYPNHTASHGTGQHDHTDDAGYADNAPSDTGHDHARAVGGQSGDRDRNSQHDGHDFGEPAAVR